MKALQVLGLTLVIVSCAPIYVNYDYDKQADFNNYKTYNYYRDMQTGLSELDTKRLLDALDLKMKEKGFSISNTPDFFIDIYSSEFQGAQRQTIGFGVGGGGGNAGGGMSIGLPIGQAQINREIIIDFIDEDKKQLFWQAVAESSFNPKATPEKREAKLQALIEKIFAKYPPKQ